MMLIPPRGLIINLVTPLNDQGKVDGEAIVRLMRRLGGEADAFLAGSAEAGEALLMARDDRLGILEAVLNGRSKAQTLIFDITTGSEATTSDLLKRAERLLEDKSHGISFFYYLAPLVYRGNRELPQHIAHLTGMSRRRFILANDPDRVAMLRPGPHHKNIRTSVLKKIAANEQVVGLAFIGDFDRAINYQRALKMRTGFRFYDASEENFIERPSSSGLISCGANIMPEAWADIVGSSLNIYANRRYYSDQLNRILSSGKSVRSLLKLYLPDPPAYIKAALKMMKVLEVDALAGNRPGLDSNEEASLRNALVGLGLI